MTATGQRLERLATMPRLIGIGVGLAVLQIVVLAVITARLPEPDSHPSPQGIKVVAMERGISSAQDAWVFDPTLFVLPRPEGVSGRVWMRPYALESPRTQVEVPGITIDAEFGGTGDLLDGFLGDLDRSRRVVEKPPTREFDMMEGIEVSRPGSRLRLVGALQERVLRVVPDLPEIRATSNVFPTVVRLVVDTRGTVTGVALTSKSGNVEADNLAKQIASALRFEPLDARTRSSAGSEYTSGSAVFDWSAAVPGESGTEGGE